MRPVDLHPSLPAPPKFKASGEPVPPPETGDVLARFTGGATAADASAPRAGGNVPAMAAGRPAGPVIDAPPGQPPSHAPRGQLWWTAFADPSLDAAIEEGMRNNYTIRDLRNLIYENELDPLLPYGPLWPLRINGMGHEQRVYASAPPALGGRAYNFNYMDSNLGLEGSYQVDLFGQIDETKKTLEDLIEQQRQSTEVQAQTVAEQITQLWFEILEQRALLNLLQNQIAYSQDLLKIVNARFEQHLTPHLVVLQQQQILLAIQAQVPLSVAAIALLNSKLSLLLGRTPTPNAEVIPFDRQLPDLPPTPEVGSPADLLRNSPELRFAQARSAEGEHLKSLNETAWLPTIELYGTAAAERYNVSALFFNGTMGVRLTYAIFDGNQRYRKGEQLELTIDRRNWQYELAFNTAIQKVQDALVQEAKQADHVRTVKSQVELARHVLVEARQLFEQGLSDYLPVLQALNALLTLERASLSAQRLLLSYRATLYHSLGGTWSKAVTHLSSKVPS